MHIEPDAIDRMNLAELEDLRYALRLSKRELCRRGSFNPCTYQRWMRFVRGEDGGSRPHQRSLRVVREVLKDQVACHRGECDRPAA